MNFVETELPGVVVVVPKVLGDDRGFFLETFRVDRFMAAGIPCTFVQDNHSRSKRGVLRGLHFQSPNHQQAKLVYCPHGALFDVAVDIRSGSPTFGRWVGVELSESNRRLLFIPAGFAHGFCALSEEADLAYKCTDYYSPVDDRGVFWDDPRIGIQWPIKQPQVSPKDANLPRLSELSPDVLPVYPESRS